MADNAETQAAERVGFSDSGRLEAFSDGVLAVAITLLVLDLKVPHVGEGSLFHALVQQWPAYAAYATSFLIIGVMWLNHHTLFKQIRFVDRGLLLINLLLLLFIVAIPFAASLVSDYLREPGWNAKLSMVVYSAVSVCIAVCYCALWGHALWNPELLEEHVDVALSRRKFPRYAIGIAIYLLVMGVAMLNAIAALIMILLLVVYYSFQQLPVGRRS